MDSHIASCNSSQKTWPIVPAMGFVSRGYWTDKPPCSPDVV